ncbi:peroxidase superfamily protein [Actinidia rufa]|uniref:Peroxidase n=1 Tax=Actinidia rufa TaxID=165716 RepID=A0A7J0EM78_9ERIC|nr:peroxidase superfamily protein [Actinidia rufa]
MLWTHGIITPPSLSLAPHSLSLPAAHSQLLPQILPQVRTDHARHRHQQADHVSNHRRRLPPPLLPRLSRRRLRRLRPRLLHPFQLRRARRRRQPLLPGDAFDLVVRAKTALELACADILAVAARNLVIMMGGPYYAVKLGRKDGFISKSTLVEGNIPKPTMSMTQLIKLFASKGFAIQEMVALTGAHTIGFSHCSEFSTYIYNYTKNSPSDPSYNPRYADGLRKACADYQSNPTISVFNDIMTPNKFDNAYFQSLSRGLGLLSSDRALYSDLRTRPYVENYAANQTSFFEAFGRAMEKLSLVGVKTGRGGEIRRRCDAIN